jgi:hypothetical protein
MTRKNMEEELVQHDDRIVGQAFRWSALAFIIGVDRIRCGLLA